ncbi:hypothetical protein GUJ93_ZPchr0009g2054 [Zizania palustris]|uniref:Uncharacterized protein n=1 Tax=Zizania palustris TaxID=103762 RepID=A0A8J5R444_ZIZPA|nr:hypothetical protein GUJ93_ZPchr0009g2054 [Zizania palustris]
MEPHTAGGGGEGGRRLRATSVCLPGHRHLRVPPRPPPPPISSSHSDLSCPGIPTAPDLSQMNVAAKKFSGKVIEKLSGGAPDTQMKIKTWSY